MNSDELVEEARKLVNPVVLVGEFDDDEDEMTPTYPPPCKYDANAAVDMLADRIQSLTADNAVLREALEGIERGDYNSLGADPTKWPCIIARNALSQTGGK